MMDWTAIASGSGVLVVAVGLVFTWRRNGREQKTRDENEAIKQALRDRETERSYQAIVRELHHSDHGLGAIEKKLVSFELNTTDRLGRHDERITNLEG